MPDRIALAASHATGLGAQPPGAPPLPLPSESDPILSVLRALGLDDPLGVAQPADVGAGLRAGTMGPAHIREWLGKIISPTATNTAAPSRLRITSYDPDQRRVQLREPVDSPGPAHDIGIADFQRMLQRGKLAPEPGPYEGLAVPQLIAKLRQILNIK